MPFKWALAAPLLLALVTSKARAAVVNESVLDARAVALKFDQRVTWALSNLSQGVGAACFEIGAIAQRVTDLNKEYQVFHIRESTPYFALPSNEGIEFAALIENTKSACADADQLRLGQRLQDLHKFLYK